MSLFNEVKIFIPGLSYVVSFTKQGKARQTKVDYWCITRSNIEFICGVENKVNLCCYIYFRIRQAEVILK